MSYSRYQLTCILLGDLIALLIRQAFVVQQRQRVALFDQNVRQLIHLRLKVWNREYKEHFHLQSTVKPYEISPWPSR